MYRKARRDLLQLTQIRRVNRDIRSRARAGTAKRPLRAFRAFVRRIEADLAFAHRAQRDRSRRPFCSSRLSTFSFQLALYERDHQGGRALANIPREGYIDFNNFPFRTGMKVYWLNCDRRAGQRSAFITAR